MIEPVGQITQPRQADWYDLTVGSARRGYDTAAMGQEAFKDMMGLENDLDQYKQSLASDEYNFRTDNWWQRGISSFAEQVGQWGRS